VEIAQGKIKDLSQYEFDELENVYHGIYLISLRPIKVVLQCLPGESKEVSQTRLENTVGWIHANNDRLWAKAMNELIPIKNDGWLHEGEKPVDGKAFLGKMNYDRWAVYADGRMELSLTATYSLFWGHDVEIGILADRVVDYVTLVG
jgi:hypothetical protein